MSRNHLWAWAGVVCVVCAAAVYAQQDQTAGDGGSASASVAAVPRLIKFSGTVRDARGEPVTSVAVRLTFAVYSEQQGGAALWVESQVAQLDEGGHYTVLLGATRGDGLPVELFPAGKARWLGVQVEGRDEEPRVLLVSVPYALKAEDAAMLGGRSAADFVLGEQLKEEVRTQVAAQTPGIATQAVEMLVSNPPNRPAITEGPSTFTCATTGDCVAVAQSGTGRALRTTATSASETVLVQQNGAGYGLRALSLGNVALLGQVTGSAGTSYGVKGQTTSTTGAGVFGYNLAATGLAYGVLGQTSSTSGTALFGRATATTGATIGLRGHADSTSGTGIVGQATATTGTTTGILGRVFSSSGTALIVDNTQGGKLLSGKVGSLEKFSVDGGGNVYATGVWTGSRGVLTVATGTPPLSVNSTTLVPNLNADLLDGIHASSLAVQSALDGEAATRASADTALQSNLNAEAMTRATADTNEATLRAVADEARVLKSGDIMSGTLNLPALIGGTGSFSGSTSEGVLHVTQTGSGPALWVSGSSAEDTSALVSVTNADGGIGVLGGATAPNGQGVVGTATATTGNGWGVSGLTQSIDGAGVWGNALATEGNTTGVLGLARSTSGRGVVGRAYATSGYTVGVYGRVHSPDGVAGQFDNLAGGKILSGQVSGQERFAVDGSGNITASGSVTATSFVGPLSGIASDLDCVGCVSPPELDFDPATQTELDAESTARASGDTTLSGALDAHKSSGDHDGRYARLDIGNSFVGNQGITGNLTLSGSINSALSLQGNVTGSSFYTSANLIGGHSSNSVTSGVTGATIAGGGAAAPIGSPNRVTDDFGTVSGGWNNRAGDNAGTTYDKRGATVGGGAANSASGDYSTVGGGSGNTASKDMATVAGGYSNTASGSTSTVAGGMYNTASGDYAMVPGGEENVAQGAHSFAGGYEALAAHNGAFVWGDFSGTSAVSSTGTNQFVVRASGGVWFYTSSSLDYGATLASGSGSWSSVSDRNAKQNFAPVEGAKLLARLAAIPVLTWNYKAQDPSIRHLGPMAQDFRTAFGLGEDEKHIATVDADGVALAGVQALYQLSQEKDRIIKAQGEEIKQLSQQLEELRARLARLEKAILGK